MSRSMLLVFLVLSLVVSLFPARRVSAETRAIHGVVTFDRRFVTIKPINPGQSLNVMMRFDPQDQQDLRNHSGFFLLDEDRLRAVYAGGSPIFNNIAAGTLDIYGPTNELHAAVTQAAGEYTVVIYNDTNIPMNFELSVENGTFPMEMEEAQQAEQPAESAVQPAAVESRDVGIAETLNEVYVVESGDSLSLIAVNLYGNFQYYEQLCSYNGISNCNVIEVGQQIRTPALSLLTGAAAPAAVVRSVAVESVAPAVSTPTSASAANSTASTSSATAGDSYTVVAGDTLGTIAQQFYGDSQRYRDVCSFNALADCNVISVGQVLRLPDGNTPVQSPAVAQVPASPNSVPTPAPAPAPAPAALIPVSPATAPTSAPTPVPPVNAPPAALSTGGGLDIAATLEKSSDKSVFLLLWNTTGLSAILRGNGPLTLFVPSDASFTPALQANLNTWMDNKQILQRLLSHHMLAQNFDPASVTGAVNLPTLARTTIRVERTANGGLLVDGVPVIGSPIVASNGTIYTLDKVLTPPAE